MLKSKWMGRIGIAFVFGIILLCCPPVFYLNDDVAIRSILSGAYTGVPNGHAVYMQYPLTGILALLYRLVSIVPWMETFFLFSLFMGILFVAESFESYWKGSVIALALFIPFCLYMHYTLVAALLAATGVFLLALGKRCGWAVGFLLCAYLVRSQIGLLALPFAACAIIWNTLSCEKHQLKEKGYCNGKVFLGVLGGILLCSTINTIFYGAENWQEYLAYNENRTLLYDYTDFLSTDYYEKNLSAFSMTEEEFTILSGYNTLLDGRITTEKIATVAQNVTERMKNEQPEGSLLNVLRTYYHHVRYQDRPISFMWVLVWGVLIVSLIWKKSLKHLGIAGLLLLGRSSIWMYLLGKGRFPERVSLSLYMIEILLLLGMLLSLWLKWKVSGKKGTQMFVIVFLCSMIFLCGIQWKNIYNQVQQQKKIQKGWEVLTEYCANQPDCLYLVDVFSAVEYAGSLFEKDAGNVKMAGGWMTASPLSKEVFGEWNATDGAQALYENDKVRLIVAKNREINKLETYFEQRFGDCQLVRVGEIDWPEGKGFAEYLLQISP